MGLVAVISITQNLYAPEVMFWAGALAIVSLIITISIGLLISESRYRDSWTSSTLEACSLPLLLTFAAIVVSKIILII